MQDVPKKSDAPSRAVRGPHGAQRFSKGAIWFGQTAMGLFIMWLALDGLASLWVGALFALAGAGAGVWLVPTEFYPWRPVRMLLFAIFFVQASFRGGVDVALRALSPSLPIQPEIIVRHLDLPAGLPRTTMVAATSLLPGTLSVVMEADGDLHVHTLTPAAADTLPRLEYHVRKLYSLKLPEDEA